MKRLLAALVRFFSVRAIGLGQKQFWGSMLLLAVLASPSTARAQASGTVSGRLLDAATNEPLPFAGVVLLRATDSSFVAGAQTLETGAFAIEKVPFGSYVLRASVVGYRTGQRAVALTAAAPTLQLGPLRLRVAATKLAEVVVKGERAIVTDNLDKKVIDVTKDLTATGGTAVDVLQNVPSVTVDQSGAVSLRGSTNVKIFVDGKPTGVTLDQLPASSIQTIEVVTNPSSRYDAEGSAGIINIVLKKERQDGWNGQASATAGTGQKYNTSLGLNYHKGKVNVFGSYDFRDDRRTGYGSVRQRTTRLDTTVVLNQDRSSVSQGISHAVRLGLDYALTPDQTLTLTVQPRFNTQDNRENILSTQTNLSTGDMPPLGNSTRYVTNAGTAKQADFSLDYRRLWPAQKRRELTANAIYTPVQYNIGVNSDVNFRDQTTGSQHQQFNTQNDLASAQIDYVMPVGEKGRYELGAKSISRRSDNDYQYRSRPVLAFDPSNRFIYHEYIQAAYGTYANAAGDFSYQFGLRLEQTNTRGDQSTDVPAGHFTRSYLSLFPSAVLAYDVSKENRVQLSYSRRVQRPSADELNPFPDRSDPLNLRTGNPLLIPEFVHSLELGNQRFFGASSSVSATAFYRLEENTITNIRDPFFRDPVTNALVTNTTRLNVGQETNYGLELVASAPVTSIWKVSANTSAFRRIIKGSTPTNLDFNNSNIVYTARLNTTVSPTKKLDLQLSANYRSPVVSAQGQRLTQFSADFAAKQSVLKDKGNITLRVSDIFNTLQFNFNAYGPGFESLARNKRESRILYLGFSYRFGNAGDTPRSKRKDEQPDDAGGRGFE
ncbi:outer membrane beta-barrel protein [Hymenobacter artigasi]|uniref:Outer membrane receptor protein involved in Fe transport n=1 Tax=Hymenobacter artigasi TaxID=2719616 RepID=A0ABX1HLL3_9BACT|nr:outer membrane beta-barrel protein [Hymenobacter artigasi]NKI91153.1 outer membrane receptor protein involved in Fe transport [Hymenobacter artigasi]